MNQPGRRRLAPRRPFLGVEHVDGARQAEQPIHVVAIVGTELPGDGLVRRLDPIGEADLGQGGHAPERLHTAAGVDDVRRRRVHRPTEGQQVVDRLAGMVLQVDVGVQTQAGGHLLLRRRRFPGAGTVGDEIDVSSPLGRVDERAQPGLVAGGEVALECGAGLGVDRYDRARSVVAPAPEEVDGRVRVGHNVVAGAGHFIRLDRLGAHRSKPSIHAAILLPVRSASRQPRAVSSPTPRARAASRSDGVGGWSLIRNDRMISSRRWSAAARRHIGSRRGGPMTGLSICCIVRLPNRAARGVYGRSEVGYKRPARATAHVVEVETIAPPDSSRRGSSSSIKPPHRGRLRLCHRW
jgi:hypothetical protein